MLKNAPYLVRTAVKFPVHQLIDSNLPGRGTPLTTPPGHRGSGALHVHLGSGLWHVTTVPAMTCSVIVAVKSVAPRIPGVSAENLAFAPAIVPESGEVAWVVPTIAEDMIGEHPVTLVTTVFTVPFNVFPVCVRFRYTICTMVQPGGNDPSGPCNSSVTEPAYVPAHVPVMPAPAPLLVTFVPFSPCCRHPPEQSIMTTANARNAGCNVFLPIPSPSGYPLPVMLSFSPTSAFFPFSRRQPSSLIPRPVRAGRSAGHRGGWRTRGRLPRPRRGGWPRRSRGRCSRRRPSR